MLSPEFDLVNAYLKTAGGAATYQGCQNVLSTSAASHHPVEITKAHNGFIVKIGCKTFVSTDWKKLCDALEEYWKDPVMAQKKYVK